MKEKTITVDDKYKAAAKEILQKHTDQALKECIELAENMGLELCIELGFNASVSTGLVAENILKDHIIATKARSNLE